MDESQQMTWKRAGLALGLLALLLALTALPLALLLRDALPPAGSAAVVLQRLLGAPGLAQAVLHTLAVALLACGLASVLAIPLAFAAVRAGATARVLINALALLPLMLPPFLTAAVARHLLGRLERLEGLELPAGLAAAGSSLTLVLVFALHFFPFVLYSVARGLADTDRGLQESARNLGAGRLWVWHRITLALATPAYVFGASLMVLRIVEDVGSALVLEVDGLLAPQVLASLGTSGAADPRLLGAALALLLVSLLTVGLAWTELSRGSNLSTAAPTAQALRWGRGAGARLWQALLVGMLAVVALTPHLWLTVMALGSGWSDALLPSALDPGALWSAVSGGAAGLHSTLQLAALAGALTLLLGLVAGRLPGRAGWPGALTRGVVTLLYGLPGVVLALAYHAALEGLDIRMADWPLLAMLALALVVALKQLPFAQRLLAAPAPAHSDAALAAARNLGARGPGLAAVGLPLLAGPLLGLFLLGATAAAMELSAALVLLGGADAPLAVEVFRALRDPATADAGAARGLLLVLGLAVPLLPVYWLLARRRHRQPCVDKLAAVPGTRP